MPEPDFFKQCRRIIADLGIAPPDQVSVIAALAGGVSSDIALVQAGEQRFCVKAALEKLRVAEAWYAPQRRNLAEYRWLEFAGRIVPGAVPQLYGISDRHGGFVMEYIDPSRAGLWKSLLLEARKPNGEATAVAKTLVRIHNASASDHFPRREFANRDDFRALRLEPYLDFTATRHPGVAPVLHGLSKQLYENDTALVHGDISPKNILVENGRPILLDAECATMGDPAFDIAFCINHLVLKSFHLPAMAAEYRTEAMEFWKQYEPEILWEPAGQLEMRVAALVPALMLARVDGKSPVEYLSEARREAVRRIALTLLAGKVEKVSGVILACESGS